MKARLADVVVHGSAFAAAARSRIETKSVKDRPQAFQSNSRSGARHYAGREPWPRRWMGWNWRRHLDGERHRGRNLDGQVDDGSIADKLNRTQPPKKRAAAGILLTDEGRPWKRYSSIQ
jgi:hypothetical protein